jgi:two-component system cell cycle response regulator DivK
MSRPRILIVEDSLDIAQPLADAFRFADFDVLHAADAVHAMQLATEARPDVILMDIQLPDLDGLSVAKTLKSDPATAHIPIIAMTAYEIVGEQAKTIARLCMAYAQKPVRPRELINLASAILKLSADSPIASRRSSSPKAPAKPAR